MSVPRVISQTRSALSRGFTTRRATGSLLHLVSTAAPQRAFSSSARVSEEAVQTSAAPSEVPSTATRSGAPGNNALSIAVTKLPWSSVPADVEQLLRKAGVSIKKLQFRVDRFTFQCDTAAFIELGSQEQVQKAIKSLDGTTFNGRTLRVSQVADTFYWESGFKKEHRFFFYDAATSTRAIQGLLDGRRYVLYVENPGWVHPIDGKSIAASRRDIVETAFQPFNVEVFGSMNSVWKVDKRSSSTFLTYIDFATKQDALRAVDALNGTIIKGKRVELRPYTIVEKRAEQMGKVDRGVLAKLQDAGLLPTKIRPVSV